MRTPDGTQARDKTINLRVTPEQWQLIKLASRSAGTNKSAWIRWILAKELEAIFGKHP